LLFIAKKKKKKSFGRMESPQKPFSSLSSTPLSPTPQSLVSDLKQQIAVLQQKYHGIYSFNLIPKQKTTIILLILISTSRCNL